jgi:glutaredoxin
MGARVVLYSQPDCHLCEEARGLLDGWGIAYELIDSDPRYVLRVPVIEVDGAVVAEAPVDERRLRKSLVRAGFSPS